MFVLVEELQLHLIDLSGKWRSADIDAVILFYEKNSFLWDTTLMEYRDRTKKNVALEDLVRTLDYRKSSTEIQSKFENLKTTFFDKLKKGNTGDEGKSYKQWAHYQSLSFLKKIAFQRPSFTSIISTVSYINIEMFMNISNT